MTVLFLDDFNRADTAASSSVATGLGNGWTGTTGTSSSCKITSQRYEGAGTVNCRRVLTRGADAFRVVQVEYDMGYSMSVNVELESGNNVSTGYRARTYLKTTSSGTKTINGVSTNFHEATYELQIYKGTTLLASVVYLTVGNYAPAPNPVAVPTRKGTLRIEHDGGGKIIATDITTGSDPDPGNQTLTYTDPTPLARTDAVYFSTAGNPVFADNVQVTNENPATPKLETGLTLRYQDDKNYWAVVVTDTRALALRKVQNGVAATVWASADGVVANGDSVEAETNGDTITIYRQGNFAGQHVDAFLSGRTQHGLYSSSDGSTARYIDNFAARELTARYRVRRDGVPIYDGTATSHVDVVTPGTYSYTLSRYDRVSEATTAPQPGTSYATPQRPTGLTATPGDRQIALTWNTTTFALFYRVHRNGTLVYDGPATSFTDTGLQNGTEYRYNVIAGNACGVSQPTTPDLLARPVGAPPSYDITKLMGPPTKTTPRILVSVFQPDGVTLIAHVPRRRAVKWQDEINAPGSGSFQIHLDDATLKQYPNLLTEFNIVKFGYGTEYFKAWIIESIEPTLTSSGEKADEWYTISGRGVMALLEGAIVYPEYGLRDFAPEDRFFDYSSKEGEWRIPTEWQVPVGYRWDADTTARAKGPAGWPDPAAQWIWSSDPGLSAEPGRNWFRSTFTLPEDQTVVLYATCDNAMEVRLDGVTLGALTSPLDDRWAFRTLYTDVITLSAGEHTLAAAVDNFATSTGANNPGAFIFTAFKADSDGNPTTVNVLRSTPASFIVKPYGDPPGWRAAQIIKQLIVEAQARGVAGLGSLTFTHTPTADSEGVEWKDAIQDRSVKVGTTDLLDMVTQLIELAMDFDINAYMQVACWNRRGYNYNTQRQLRAARDLTDHSAQTRVGKLRNQALLKSEIGWMEVASPSSKEKYGRRETGLTAGNAGSPEQVALIGTAALVEGAVPETTITVSYTSVRGPQPYTDINLGDTISVPNKDRVMVPVRVMAITGSENENHIGWDLDVYPADEAVSVVITSGGTYGAADNMYQQAVLSDSPWGYWRLEEASGTTFADKSGNGRNMALTGSATLNQAGPVSRAVTWPATAAHAVASKQFAQGIATLEVWVYLEANPAARTAILAMAAGEPGHGTHDKELVIETTGAVSFYTSPAGTGTTLTSPSALALNTWHHIVGSIGAEGMKLFVDGTRVGFAAAVTTSYSGNQNVYLRAGGAGAVGTGVMRTAEPAVYYQQLLDSRILAHFQQA